MDSPNILVILVSESQSKIVSTLVNHLFTVSAERHLVGSLFVVLVVIVIIIQPSAGRW
jgi:hypothetical protein